MLKHTPSILITSHKSIPVRIWGLLITVLLLLPYGKLTTREWRSLQDCAYRSATAKTESTGQRFILVITDSLRRPVARYEGTVEIRENSKALWINLPPGYGSPQPVVVHEEEPPPTVKDPASLPQKGSPLHGLLLTFLAGCLFSYGWWSVKRGIRQLPSPEPQPEDGEAAGEESEFSKNLRAMIEDHLDDPDLTAHKLSRLLLLGYATCLRRVKAATGMTISEYIKYIRIRRAASLLLEQPDQTIAAVAYEVGFASHNHFSREFRKLMGCTPSEYRVRGMG